MMVVAGMAHGRIVFAGAAIARRRMAAVAMAGMVHRVCIGRRRMCMFHSNLFEALFMPAQI